MVFPVESEDRTMRNLLMLCQDHARLVVEIFRKVLVMIDALVKEDATGLPGSLEEIEKLHQESLEVKRTLLKELHEIGGMLINREDLYRLITKSSKMVDHIKGIGVRLWEIGEKEWEIPEKAGEGLVKMAGVSFEFLTKLRQSLMSLGFNSEQALVLARQVDEGEREMDSLFRAVDLDIMTSSSEIPVILILRDVAEMLDNVIDMAAEAADLIRILAL